MRTWMGCGACRTRRDNNRRRGERGTVQRMVCSAISGQINDPRPGTAPHPPPPIPNPYTVCRCLACPRCPRPSAHHLSRADTVEPVYTTDVYTSPYLRPHTGLDFHIPLLLPLLSHDPPPPPPPPPPIPLPPASRAPLQPKAVTAPLTFWDNS